jgi:DNA polymerase-3 subunit delta
MAGLAKMLAHEQGMRLDPEAARLLAAQAGSDRAILAREIEKLALYLDASPAMPQEAGRAAVDAIGADNGEPDLSGLTDAVLGGMGDRMVGQLALLAADGVDGIALLRAVSRRVHLLLKLKADLARNKPLEALLAPIFWKDRAPVSAQLKRWPTERLATAAERLLAAERAIKAARSPGPVLAEAELVRIARAARR